MATELIEDQELVVTFFPPLYLQRQIWVLNILRQEGIVDVLDVGCGEGRLLGALSVPSLYLAAPAQSILYPEDQSPPESSPVNLFNTSSEPIPNLHITRLAGLDLSGHDLKFAVEATTPVTTNSEDAPIDPWRYHKAQSVRWEEMTVKIFQGGLEAINEEFVGVECIVSSEVIEHLPPPILPFFAPILMGVYKPKFFLITTPNYTFNERFTSPSAPPAVRLKSGYWDPTGRTERIFRHLDHKFEWTHDEFREYCEKEAQEWGYIVEVGDIGRAQEEDQWNRDAELGGASQVAKFTRVDDESKVDRDSVERKARTFVETLAMQRSSSTPTEARTGEHLLLVTHYHPAHPRSQNPRSFREIGDIIKTRMEELRESFIRIEELWYDIEVSQACGGWIELLIRAVEEYDSGMLTLTREAESPGPFSPSSDTNIQRQREMWKIGLAGGTSHPRPLWPTTEINEDENDRSMEYMPADWNPEKEYASEYGNDDYVESAPSSSADWDREETEEISTSYSTGEEGDISWGEDDLDEDVSMKVGKLGNWGALSGQWGESVDSDWGDGQTIEKPTNSRTRPSMPQSSSSSMTGWDGDDDESDNTDTAS
ncbi:hypothetical protein BDP27DRAFT_1451498 [Rhodocollybia butyracea]|uniref:Small RNA 2'-O-methyltransferase n=1 Tax=Rhodocollybia butyracea TaxID=206335 RepID=A0A9P5U0W0_9AGAR|nr:hypothetical protein BDP27DRAFT_1451498 [Rhodocollybia butyracea]